MLATGGVSMDNVARYNNVTVTGGTIKGSIYGGMSGINAIENKVMISGGNIGGDVLVRRAKLRVVLRAMKSLSVVRRLLNQHMERIFTVPVLLMARSQATKLRSAADRFLILMTRTKI